MSTSRPFLQTFEQANQGLTVELELLNAIGSTVDNTVLIWKTQQSLVVPAAFVQKPHFQAASERSARRGWPVALRPTGGGTTPQGPGILNAAIAFHSSSQAKVTIHGAYRAICQPLQDTLAELDLHTTCQAVPGSFCDGRYNIALNQRKLVGTAQRWRRGRAHDIGGHDIGGHDILAHALILHSADIAAVTQAINAFHNDLGISDTIHPTVHTTLAEAGIDIEPIALARLLHQHFKRYLKNVIAPTLSNPTVQDDSGCKKTSVQQEVA